MPRKRVSQASQLVLIVEDDDRTREMYAERLNFSGLRIAEARDGPEAIEKARDLRPDVIATNAALTGTMDGWELTESLKAYADTHKIPVIFLTEPDQSTDMERALKSGCDAVLLKPCLPETLLATIRELLATHPSGSRNQKR